MDLREQERYWLCIREGRPHDYHGIAIHPRHLSLWETYVLHRNRYYNPQLDRQDKIQELRVRYEASISNDSEEELDDFEPLSEKVTRYFQMEREKSGKADVSKGSAEKVKTLE